MITLLPQQDWKAFIDGFPDSIANYAADYTHLYINQTIEKETGLPAAHLLGKSNRQLSIPGDEQALQAIEKAIDSVFETRQTVDHYTQHAFAEGIRYYFMKFIPQLDAQQQVISVWAITRNITELKYTQQLLEGSQQTLQQQNQALDQANHIQQTLLYTIAHDLRNPAGNIKSIAHLLRRNSQGTTGQDAVLLDLLEGATNRLEQVLSELTAMLEQTHQSSSSYSLSNILARIEAEFKDLLVEANAELIADFSSCPSVQFPKAYLESLFRNMVSNAIKYRSSQRVLRLQITSKRSGEGVQIQFADNGQGMDLAQHRAKLFTAFYRIAQEKSGHGMDLHIVQRMLEENGGRMHVESRLEEGTTFTCYLKER